MTAGGGWTALRHVTLESGHVRTSPRAEVSAEPLRALAPIVAAALDGERPELPVPSERPVTLRFTAAGAGWAEWAIEAGGWPLVSCRLEWTEPEPLLSVSLGAGLLAEPGASEWLGDVERCIAWAVLDRLRLRRPPPRAAPFADDHPLHALGFRPFTFDDFDPGDPQDWTGEDYCS